MSVSSSETIPPALRRKISSALLMSVGRDGRALKMLGIGLAAAGLYGPITVNPDHNGVLYLLGPWIAPTVVALLYTFVPFRPYRGVFWAKNMHEVDEHDPVVMRLVELYKSDEARRHVWHESLKISGILFAILGTAAFLLRDSLNWTLPSSLNQFLWTQRQGPGHWFWVGFIGSFIGSYLALSAAYIGWGLTTWVEREAKS